MVMSQWTPVAYIKYCPTILLDGPTKAREVAVRLAGLHEENRIVNLPNM